MGNFHLSLDLSSSETSGHVPAAVVHLASSSELAVVPSRFLQGNIQLQTITLPFQSHILNALSSSIEACTPSSLSFRYGGRYSQCFSLGGHLETQNFNKSLHILS